MTAVDLTFIERVAVKLGVGAMHGAKAFLEANGARRPTSDEMTQIARQAAPLIERMVREAGPTIETTDEAFTELAYRAVAIAAGVAAQVMGLVPAPPRASVN